MTKNDTNIQELIKEEYRVPESVFDKRRTKTSHFMLNSIFHNSSLTNTEYFINAFTDDGAHEHDFTRPLFLLFRVGKNDLKWNARVLPALRSRVEYIMDYYCGFQDNKDLIMVVYQIPEKFAGDYALFKEGKYSQFSDAYKKLFNRNSVNDRLEPVESIIWRVLHKSKALKAELEAFFGEPVRFTESDELWGKPLPEYEVYRFKKGE